MQLAGVDAKDLEHDLDLRLEGLGERCILLELVRNQESAALGLEWAIPSGGRLAGLFGDVRSLDPVVHCLVELGHGLRRHGQLRADHVARDDERDLDAGLAGNKLPFLDFLQVDPPNLRLNTEVLVECGALPRDLVLAAGEQALPLGFASHLLFNVKDAASAARHALALDAVALEDLVPLDAAVLEQRSGHFVVSPFDLIDGPLERARIKRV